MAIIDHGASPLISRKIVEVSLAPRVRCGKARSLVRLHTAGASFRDTLGAAPFGDAAVSRRLEHLCAFDLHLQSIWPAGGAILGARDDLLPLAIWADALSEEEAARALKGITEKRYLAGAYVCHRGDRLDQWTGVVTGLVKISAISESGKPMTFAGVGAGGWFGEGTVLKNEPRKYDLVALRDTRMAMLNRPTFMWLFENSVGFNRFLVHQLNERMGQFIATIESDRIHDPTARVARHLAWLFNPVLYPNAGDHIEITQEELALLAGISRQVANKVLMKLEAAGLLVTERGGIRVPDPVALGRFGG
jgi:CRP/FNR family transcriptional regulator, cyclic AMP receptor protein